VLRAERVVGVEGDTARANFIDDIFRQSFAGNEREQLCLAERPGSF
jgi:hypothetical protein